MGNYEYCEHCEENDFHYGKPCDPEKKRLVDLKKYQENERFLLLSRKRDLILKKIQEKFHIKGHIDKQYGSVKFHLSEFDLIDELMMEIENER